MDLLNSAENIGYNFANDQLYKAYEGQVRGLREALLGNKISYVTNGNNASDRATKAYNTKVFAYSLALQYLNQARQIKIEERVDKTYKTQDETIISDALKQQQRAVETGKEATKEYYANLDKQAENTASTNISFQGALDKEVDYHYLDINKRAAELEGLKFKNWEGNKAATNADNEKQTKKFWEDKRGPDELSRELSSSGFESTKESFPQPGSEITTQSTENGIKFVNRASYEANNNGRKETIFRGWTKGGVPDPDKYSTPANPMSEKVARMVEEYRRVTPGAYKFFIEKLHGRSVSGASYGKNPIVEGKTRSDYPNRMLFPAYINAFNDSYDASWSSYSFIGRGEDVHVYQKTSRKLALDFYIISDFSAELLLNAIEEERSNNNPIVKATADGKLNFSKGDLNKSSFTSVKDMAVNAAKNGTVGGLKALSKEDTLSELQRLLPDWGSGAYPIPGIVDGEYTGTVGGQVSGTPEMLWARLTFLAQCIYPWYRKDGKLKEQPFVRVRIGDFIDCVAKIDSLSLGEYDQFDMDLNPSSVGAIPMGVKVALSMTIVHEEEPTSNYSRFYWRKDFDKEAYDYVPLGLSETSTTLDPTLDAKKTGSAISDKDPGSSYGETSGSFPKEQIQNQEEKSKFSSSMKKLKESAGNLNSNKTSMLKTALLAAKRLLEAKAMSEASLLKNVNPEQLTGAAGALKDNSSKIKSLVPRSQEDPSSPDEKPRTKKTKLFKQSGSNSVAGTDTNIDSITMPGPGSFMGGGIGGAMI